MYREREKLGQRSWSSTKLLDYR